MDNTAKVIDFTERFTVINGKANNGSTKITSDDMHKAKWVDPIRELSDIKKIENLLQEKIDSSSDARSRKIYARNKLLFILGTRTGFRVNDLLAFRWGLIFNKSGKYYDNVQRVVEHKTGKVRALIITTPMKKEIEQYISIADPDMDKNNYIFVGKDERFELYDVGSDRKVIDDITVDITTNEYEDYTTNTGKTKQRRIKDSGIKHRGLKRSELYSKRAELDRFNVPYSVRRRHMSDASVDTIIKSLAEECEIDGNYAGRSLRKTYAYRHYISEKEHGMDDLAAADNVRKIMKHSIVQITFAYLGLSQKEAIQNSEDVDWG